MEEIFNRAQIPLLPAIVNMGITLEPRKSRWQILPAEPLGIIARRFIRVE
jgi:hypothetical protein